MDEEPLQYEEFCRKTYTILSGNVKLRCLFEKHGTEEMGWNQEMVLRVYSFIADAIKTHGYRSESYPLTVLAGADTRGGYMVQIDIEGIGMPYQFLRKLHDDICQYLINVRKYGDLANLM